MNETINALIFGHKNPDTDSICSAILQERYDNHHGWNTKATRLGKINKETQFVLDYLGLPAPELIEKVEDGQSVILVDHNEFSQSVANIENAKVESVIDHHRICNFQTCEPLYYLAKPYGCTATILYEEYKKENIPIGKEEAILMLSAIISDTLLLKSPTCTKHDKKACEELTPIAGIDFNSYGLELLKAGTDLSDFTPEELITIDSKEFINGSSKFQVAQVNTACIEDVLTNKQAIEKAMEEFIANHQSDLFVFLITDIINNNSQAIVIGDTHLFEKAFSVTLKDNMAFLEGIVSRKKQVAPVLTKQ